MRMAEGPHVKLTEQEPGGINRAGHREPTGRHGSKAHLHIVILIADEDDQPETHLARILKTPPHHIDANALTPNGGHDRKRPQHQARHTANINRPECERTDQPPFRTLALKGDIAKFRDRLVTFAQPLRSLGIATGAEREIKERLDIDRVLGLFVEDFKHQRDFRTGSSEPEKREGTRRQTRLASQSPDEFGNASLPKTEDREILKAHSSSLKATLRHVHFPRSSPPGEHTPSETMPDSMSNSLRKANVYRLIPEKY